jgi:hypothetical protein
MPWGIGIVRWSAVQRPGEACGAPIYRYYTVMLQVPNSLVDRFDPWFAFSTAGEPLPVGPHYKRDRLEVNGWGEASLTGSALASRQIAARPAELGPIQALGFFLRHNMETTVNCRTLLRMQ